MGLYHYANGSGVAGEVQWFLRNVQKYIGTAVLCLDWEHIPNGGPNSQFGNPGYAKQFMDEVKKQTGVSMVIYGSKDSCFNAMDWTAVKNAGYKLWGAQYGSNNPQYGYTSTPWQSSKPWGAYQQDLTIFQYTSNLRLVGYNGGLDGNLAYVTKDQWIAMAQGKTTYTPPAVPNKKDDDGIKNASLLDLVIGVQQNKYGRGDARKNALGDRYTEVQNAINHIYGASADTLAKEVMTGKYGNGDTRKAALGSRYNEVQKVVDKLYQTPVDYTKLAREVMAGKWGNEPFRTKNLRAAGYDSVAVQKAVNKLMSK